MMMRVFAVGDERSGRRVVAARTQKEAAKALRITVKTLSQFGRVSTRGDEMEAAMRAPGLVFATVGDRYSRHESAFTVEIT